MKKNSSNISDIKKVIDEQLKLQVEISFAHHHNFMIEHDLNSCKTVLDLGTGNGFFLYNVARNHPEIKFYGFDNDIERINLAKQLNIKNIEWVFGDINQIQNLLYLQQFDAFLMRYLVLHINNANKLFTDIFNNAKKGAVLWIIDLDLNNFSCSPTHKAFDMILELVDNFCAKYSIDSKAGTKLPNLLRNIGFSNVIKKEDIWSNNNIDLDLFKNFIINEVYLYNNSLDNKFNNKEMEFINNFIKKELNNNFVIKYGMIMLSATNG